MSEAASASEGPVRNALQETYIKAKRYLLFFSGSLVLAIAIGAEPSSGSSSFPIVIKRPADWILPLYGAVFYYLFQLRLFWDAQPEPVKAILQHNLDYQISSIIGVIALVLLPGLKLCDHLWTKEIVSCVKATVTWLYQINLIRLLLITIWIAAPILFIFFFKKVFETKISSTIQEQSQKSGKIAAKLVENVWRLYFNPSGAGKTPEHFSKIISFDNGGIIPQGNNRNEASWRMNGEFLEILNSDGKVFSRFRYDETSHSFKHTNDEDTLSIKGQYMTLEHSKGGLD